MALSGPIWAFTLWGSIRPRGLRLRGVPRLTGWHCSRGHRKIGAIPVKPEGRPVTTEGSVTRWIDGLQQGDPAAAQQLWERYFRRLVGLARSRLGSFSKRSSADEEDVALSAFATLCRNASQGRFPQLHDSDDLWRLLVTITARKATHLLRDEGRQKRGGPPSSSAHFTQKPCLEEILSEEPTPEFAAQAVDECHRLMSLLGDKELEAVALLKMEGFSVAEIGQKLGYGARSIQRKLRMIRGRWQKEIAP
jgi:DNA-directed RNA polymerase specialized sigma24 family protein